jgi:hypothetical protein
MTSFPVPPERDPARPEAAPAVRITLDGHALTGIAGQTIAGIALANDQLSWRRTSRDGRPRGLFCGIGVCFDCLVTVNGTRDIRACRRRASEGDDVTVQHDALPVRADAEGASDAPGGRDAHSGPAASGAPEHASDESEVAPHADRGPDATGTPHAPRGPDTASDGRPAGPGSGGRRDG